MQFVEKSNNKVEILFIYILLSNEASLSTKTNKTFEFWYKKSILYMIKTYIMKITSKHKLSYGNLVQDIVKFMGMDRWEEANDIYKYIKIWTELNDVKSVIKYTNREGNLNYAGEFVSTMIQKLLSEISTTLMYSCNDGVFYYNDECMFYIDDDFCYKHLIIKNNF